MNKKAANTIAENPSAELKLQPLLSAIAPAALLCLNLFVFGVVAIFCGNPGEFLVSLGDVMARLVVPGGLTFLAIVAVAWMLPERPWLVFNAIITALAVATYLHGNLLYWDTGVLDGSALDLSRHWRSLFGLVLWVTLGWLAWTQRSWLARHAWKLCVLLILIQGINAATQISALRDDDALYEDYPNQLSWLSPDANVIHLILDAFQASIFEHLLAENPKLKKEFEGFTFFRDALTPSDVTYLSVPATLTGIPFNNEITISDYHERTLGGRNLLSVMAEQGFSIDIATPVWWNPEKDEFSSYFRVPTPFVGREEIETSTAMLLLDVSIFRQLPHFLKSLWYQDGTWVLSSSLTDHPEQQFQHFAHNAFLSDLSRHTVARSTRPTYKFLHLVTPHAPLVTNPDCGFSDKELEYDLESFSSQSFCTLKNVIAYLHRLKKLRLYDSATIIIHGDHGGGVPFPMIDRDGKVSDSASLLHNMWGNPLPLVLVKPQNAKGPMHVSNRPVSLLDIPATVLDLLEIEPEFTGSPMFSTLAPESSIRHYFRSSMHRNDAAARDSFDDFSNFQVSGSVYDRAAWSEEDFYQASGITGSGDYAWGTSLTFGRRGNFKPFQAGGWSPTRSEDISWTDGKEMKLAIPFQSVDGEVRATMNVKPFLVPEKLEQQHVSVYIGDSPITQWTLTEGIFQQLEFDIPRTLLNPAGSTEIRFVMPDAQAPNTLKAGEDKRRLGLAFLRLRFDVVEPEKAGD